MGVYQASQPALSPVAAALSLHPPKVTDPGMRSRIACARGRLVTSLAGIGRDARELDRGHVRMCRDPCIEVLGERDTSGAGVVTAWRLDRPEAST